MNLSIKVNLNLLLLAVYNIKIKNYYLEHLMVIYVYTIGKVEK